MGKALTDEEMTAYLAKPTTFLDWMGIFFMMILTYAITCFLLFIFTSWGANSGPDQSDLYQSCQIFNLVLFLVYVAVCATLWSIFIKRREQMKDALIKKKLAIQSKMTSNQPEAENNKLIH